MASSSLLTVVTVIILCCVQIGSATTQRMVFNRQYGMMTQGKVQNSHVFDYEYKDDYAGFTFRNDYFFGDEFVGPMALNEHYRGLGVPEHRQVYVLDHTFNINFFFVSDNARDLEIYWNDGFSYSFPFYCVTQFADHVVLYNKTVIISCNNHTSGVIALGFDLTNPEVGEVFIYRAPLQRVTTRFSSILVNSGNTLLSVVNSFASTSQYYLWDLDTQLSYAAGIIDFRATTAAVWGKWVVFSTATEEMVQVYYCDKQIIPVTCRHVKTMKPDNEPQFGRTLSFQDGMLFIGGTSFSYLMTVPADGSLAEPTLVPFWSYFPDFVGERKNMIASVVSRNQLVAKYEDDISPSVYYFQSCPPGLFWDHTRPLTDGTRCRQCPPGQYKNFEGFGLCNLCPRGTYSSEGALLCHVDPRCPAGSPAPCENLDIETRLDLFPRIQTSLPRESAEVEFFGYSLPLLWIHVGFALLVLGGEQLVLWFSHSFFLIELVHVVQSTWNLSHHADGGHDSHGHGSGPGHGSGSGSSHKPKGGQCLFLLGHVFSVIMFVFVTFIVAYIIILSHEEIVSTEIIPSIKGDSDAKDQVLYLKVKFIGYQGVCDPSVWDIDAVGLNRDILEPKIEINEDGICTASFTFADGILPRPRNIISVKYRSQTNVFPFYTQAINIVAETYNSTNQEIRSRLITNALPPQGIFNGITSVYLVSHRRNILHCRKLTEFSFKPEPEYDCDTETQTYFTVENTVAASTPENQFFASRFQLVFRFGNAEFDINTKKITPNFPELLFVAVLVNLGVYHLLHGILSFVETIVDITSKIIALRRQKKDHDIPADPSAELNYHLMKEFEGDDTH